MKPAAALALLLALESQAAVVGVVPLRGGAQLRLHDVPGICVDGALLVEYAAHGKPVLAGCWVRRGDTIQAVFLDGDSGELPVQAVQKPESV